MTVYEKIDGHEQNGQKDYCCRIRNARTFHQEMRQNQTQQQIEKVDRKVARGVQTNFPFPLFERPPPVYEETQEGHGAKAHAYRDQVVHAKIMTEHDHDDRIEQNAEYTRRYVSQQLRGQPKIHERGLASTT
jgi:hypothetical protein